MWPAKPGLGAQLTYGVSGNGIIDLHAPGDSSALGLQFPRSKSSTSSLHEIQNSYFRLSSGNKNGSNGGELFRAPKKPLSVGHDLIKAMNAEADPFRKEMGRDPSVSSLSVAFDLGVGEYTNKSKEQHSTSSFLNVRCVACVDGADSILVCPLLPKIKNVIHLSNSSESAKTLCAVPNEQCITRCKFPWIIHQIHYSGELLVVRGANEVSFVEVLWDNDQKRINLNKAFSVAIPGTSLLHSEINGNRLAVFDSERQCTIYSFWNDSEWSVKKESSKQLPACNPFDLSNFIGVHWPSGSETMVIMQRKNVLGITLDSDTVRKYINFHNWSHLLDFQRIGPDLFILTSQEIIWLRLTKDNDLQRLLSWKHYLDHTDYSLKMTLHLREKDNVIMCLIYCSNSPIIIHYSFAMRRNRPCSVKDPYYIRSRLRGISHISVCSSAFGEDDYLMNYFQIGANHEVDYMALSFRSDLAFRNHSKDNVEANQSIPPSSRFIPLVFSQVEERFLLHQFRNSRSKETTGIESIEDLESITGSESTIKNSNGSIPENSESKLDSSQVDAVQNFALELGTDIDAVFKTPSDSKTVPSFKSLATIAKDIPTTVSDLPELGSMLEQLGAFYEGRNIQLNKGDGRVVSQVIPLGTKSSDNISETLYEALQSYKQDPKIMKAVIILVSSIIKANSLDFAKNYESAIKEEATQHEQEYQDIFDDWKIDESLEVKARHTPKQAIKTSNGLLRQAHAQNSQLMSQSQSQVHLSQSTQPDLDSQPLVFHELGEEFSEPNTSQWSQGLNQGLSQSQLSQIPLSQVQFSPVKSSQEISSQSSQLRSQPKSQLKRLRSQNPSQKRKKKKGGFA